MGRKLNEVLDSLPEARRQRIAEERDAILSEIETLRELRMQAQTPTQGELASRLNVSQAAVSKTENRPPAQLSLGALDRYVEALGGTVDVRINVPGRPPVRLSRLRDLAGPDDRGDDGDAVR
jgi:transcriptional regulator with XRE-family HTH domain